MSTYLLLIIIIVIIPLIYSIIGSKIRYLENWKALLKTIFYIGGLFVIWDILVTERGHWFFSESHILGLKLFGLPIEEILFFVVVPFSCLLIWEALNYLFKEKKVNFFSNLSTSFLVFFLTILSIIFISKEYTFLVLIVTIFTIILIFVKTNFFKQKNYYYFLIIVFVLFIIFNFILTSLPIVVYNSDVITNIRILTIPLEDFFYNFSLLTLYLFVYEKNKKIKKIR